MVRNTNVIFNKVYKPVFSHLSSAINTIINNDIKISVLVCITVLSIVADTLINQNADYLVAQNTSAIGIVLFIIIASVCIIGQYLILEYVKAKTREIRSKVLYIRVLHMIVTLSQYAIMTVFVLVVINIVVLKQYPTIALEMVTAVNYGLNVALMAVFAQIFFSWYRLNRYSIVVLLYALSFATVVINSSVYIAINFSKFMEKPSHVFPYSKVVFSKYEEGSFMYNIIQVYRFSDISSFVLKWSATVFLLYHYSRKIGKAIYWVLVSIPLIYFLGTFMEDFHLYGPHSDSEFFYWYLYGALNSTAGGILFGTGFMLGARHFPEKSSIKDYMMISAFGFILFFSAGQSTLAVTPYPPYGFATMSFFALSTYLILLGLYCSAISVSEDVELRKHIKKSAQREARFMEGIGTAHMEKEFIKRMIVKAKEEQEELTEESGGVKPSISESDIINIIKEVEKDVQNQKERHIS